LKWRRSPSRFCSIRCSGAYLRGPRSSGWRGRSAEFLREQRRITNRRYYERHKDLFRERARTDRQSHRERSRATSRRNCRRRRARMFAAQGSHTENQWLSRVERFGWKCVYCGIALTKQTLTQDHVIPLSEGGSDFASNLVPACRPCNSRKRSVLGNRNLIAAGRLPWLSLAFKSGRIHHES
jgi:5-methylcytosine-specific restriction endonuclease McrA